MKIFAKNWKHLLGSTGQKWLFGSVITGIGLAVIELGLAKTIQMLLQVLGITYSEISEVNSIQPVLVWLLILGLLRSACQFFSLQAKTMIDDSVLLNCRSEFVRRLSGLGIARPSNSETIVLINDTFQRCAYFYNSISQLIPLILQLVAIIFGCFYYAWREATLGIAGLVFVGGAVLFLNKSVRVIATQLPGEQLKFSKRMNRVLNNWLLVCVSDLKTTETQSLLENAKQYSNFSVRAQFFGNIASTLPPLFGILLVVAVLWVGAFFRFSTGEATVAFVYLFLRLAMNLAALSGVMTSINQYYPDFLKAAQWHNSLLEVGKKPQQPGADAKLSFANKDAPKITVTNLEVEFVHNSPVFTGLNFSLEPGSQTAFIGPSGCGKTTLLECLLGIRTPTRGSVFIDGIPADKWLQSGQPSLGYVSVEPFLIEGTILENLLYGFPKSKLPVNKNGQVDLELLEQKARNIFIDLGLDKVIAEVGFSRKISEASEGLSAGQKQRLCLARAILIEPTLLVLDEATANLDLESESRVCEALRRLKGSCTTIIVTHRKGILAHADLILSLDSLRKKEAL